MNPENENQTIDPALDATQSVPETEPIPTPIAPKNGDHVYFQKVIASVPFFVNRVMVKFEPLANNLGVLTLAAGDPLVEPLSIAARNKRGGILQINETQFEELKKKLPYNPLAQKSKKHVLQAFQMRPPKKQDQQGESAAGTNRITGKALGVGSSGNQGTGVDAGTSAPAPVDPPASGGFKPTTAKKGFKMPVLKKTTSRSLEGGIPIPD